MAGLGRYGVLAVIVVALALNVTPANRAVLSVQGPGGIGGAQYNLGNIDAFRSMHRRLLTDLKTAQEKAGLFVDDAHLFERPLVGSQGRRPTQATDLSAVFKNPPVLATFLSMLSQGLNLGTFPGQALDLPGGSQFGYAPTDDSYCLFATQPHAPAPPPATLLPGAPTTGSPLPGEFACVDASTKPHPTPDSFTVSYAGTTYVCQGTPGLAPSPIGRKLQPALAPVENAMADTLTATGLPIWNCVAFTTPDGTTTLGQATEAIVNDLGGIAEKFLVYLNANGGLTYEHNVINHVSLADPLDLWPTGARPNFQVDFPSVDSDRPLLNSSLAKELFECPVPPAALAAPAAGPGASAAAPGTTPPASDPAVTSVNPGFTGGAATSPPSGLPSSGPASTPPVTVETPAASSAGPVTLPLLPPSTPVPLTAFGVFGSYLDNCQAVIGSAPSADSADGNFDRNNNDFNAVSTDGVSNISLARKPAQYAPLTLSDHMQAQFCHDVATLQCPYNPLAIFINGNAPGLAASPASPVAVLTQIYGQVGQALGLTTEELTVVTAALLVILVNAIIAGLAIYFYVDVIDVESLDAPVEFQVGGRSVADKDITQDVEIRQQVQAHASNSGSGGQDVEEEELHRLGFVLHHSSKAIGYLAYLYNQARTHVPEKLRPQLVAGEQFASKHGQPVVTKLADRGQEMLRVADGQIDGVINNGVSFYNSYQIMISQEFATGVGTYDTTRNFVVKSFQDLVNVALEEGLAGAIGYARVKAHATLVKQPLYKKAYDSGNNLLGAVKDTAAYKQTVKRIYPVVAPIADPAIEKIQPYYKATVAYWKPAA